jgi:flagellar biosynthesis GTPase FlhF
VKLFVKDIKFTQNNISDRFTDGTSLTELSQQIIYKQINPNAIPPIRVVNFRGMWWALDNRRLRVFKSAFIREIEVTVCELSDPNVSREFHNKRTNKTIDGGGELRLVKATANNDQHFEQGAFVFTRKVLNWSIEQARNENLIISRDEDPIKKEWFGINSYYRSFLDLILEEARAIIHAGLDAKETQKTPPIELTIKISKFPNNSENPATLTFERKTNFKDIQIKPNDVFLLQSATKKEVQFIALAGYLKTDDIRRVQMKAVVEQAFYFFDSKLFEEGSEWHAFYLGSVVTQLRMYEVCMLAPEPPFIKAIYRGDLKNAEQDDDDKASDSSSSSSSMEFVTAQLSSLSTNVSNDNDDDNVRQQTSTIDQLNESQESVVRKFLQIKEGIQLVQGPPGTGKTTTTVALLSRLVQQGERVLVCAPSNKAVQLLAEHFVAKNPNTSVALAGVEDKLPEDERLQKIFIHTWGKKLNEEITDLLAQLWEIVPEAIKQEKTKNAIKQLEDINAKFLTIIEKIQFHKIRIIDNETKERINFTTASDNYRQLLNLYESGSVFLEKLVEQGKNFLSQMERVLRILQINLLQCMEDDTEKGLENQLLNQAKVIFATLSVAGRSQLKKMNPVTALIIDEAGQAVEAETLIPFTALPKKCLLIGDTKQLPATVISTRAEQLGFGRSMLWRLLEDCKQPYSLLTVQYRMHPSIRQWPSTSFYEGKIVDHQSITEGSRRLRGMAAAAPYLHPYALIDVKGREEKRGNTFVNEQEVEIISSVLRQFKQDYQIDVAARVGIITFYKGQVDLLNQRLQGQYRGIKIQTVDGFQGGECDFVIISFVRSNIQGSVGFLKDFRRLNVALTRARYSLIMVGDAATLREKDTNLADLITHLGAQKNIFSEEYVRSRVKPKNQTIESGSDSSNWRARSSVSSSSNSENWRSSSSTASNQYNSNSQQRSFPARRTTCRFFNGQPDSCRAGADCNFSHNLSDFNHR